MTKALQPGDKAPAFKATADDGSTVTLAALKGKTVVLYFYPKDDTSGCTKAACDVRDRQALFKKKGAIVYGVSPDGIESHAKFKTKHKLNFPLLADPEKTLCQAYGVWKEKSMYGRKYMGVERTTFIIGPDGRIQSVFPKVKVPGHMDEVLAAI